MALGRTGWICMLTGLPVNRRMLLVWSTALPVYCFSKDSGVREVTGSLRGHRSPQYAEEETGRVTARAENAFSKTNKGLYRSQETVYFGTEPLSTLRGPRAGWESFDN